MANLSIGQVARLTGLQTSAIRYYESIGLLPEPPRVSGQRRYNDDIFAQLGLIRLAQSAGLGMAEIRALLHDFPADMPPSQRWQQIANRKLAELQTLIEQAQAQQRVLETTLNCTCADLSDCGESYNPKT